MQDAGPEPLQNLYALHRPDWSTWKPVKSIRLWHAVALACDLDPYQFTAFGVAKLDRVFSRLPGQFEELLAIAKTSLGSGGILKLTKFSVDGVEESEVVPADFGAWAKELKYPLPAEFPWQDEAVRPLSRQWPWGTYETDSLRHLAAAANRFWRNYDPTDATTAPINEDVCKWLVEQGVSKRVAEVMASILRADGLATGPRK
ncbi:hypothetical protein [Duganella hordei]|uniref:hypothetical protein n=1 Tax=Duganella hordei TaxID=2865934 RepID=UPI0030E81500